MIIAFITLCLFGNVLAQVPVLGSCPDVETVKDFNISSYMGRWYEAERYFSVLEFGAKCVTADYSLGENGTVKNHHGQISKITGNPTSNEGVGSVPDASEPAKLKIKLPFGFKGDYWVLGTDYNSFAVVYSCANFQVISFKNAWILTRDQNPSAAVIAKADAVIEKSNISRSIFLKTNQADCLAASNK